MANSAVRSSLRRPRHAAWELVLFACAPLVLAVAQFSQLIEQPSKVIAKHLFLVILVRLFLLQPRVIPGSVAYATGSLLAYSPCCFLLLVLMGAPLTSQVTETAVLAVSMIAFFNLGLLCFDGAMMNGISKLVDFTHTSIKSEATRNTRIRWLATAVLAGAYVGAIPIPLDWDRDWQRWPVTVYIGACTGYTIGLLGICFHA